MADTKITALAAITTVDPAADVLPIVDVSDTSMAASGTTKKITSNQILGAGGTATLASATITGDLTVDTSTLKVDSANNRVGIGTATPANTLEVVAPAGDNIVSTFRSGDATAANNAGGGFRSISSATAASRVAQVWLDADGANLSGGDYFYIQKNGSSGTVEFNQFSNAAMTFLTNSTERMRIDSSGNLGLGVTPSAWNTSYKAFQMAGGSFASYLAGGVDATPIIASNAYVNSGGTWTYINSRTASQYSQNGGYHLWWTAGSGTAGNAITWTQAMTLDASGNLLVACTSSPTGTTPGFYFDATRYAYFSRSAGETLNLNRYTSTGATAKFRYAGTEVGDISVTGSGTTFNSISDYRLKESVSALNGGLARVNALKPSIYKWKSDGSNGEGFIAHELAEVVPLAVTGEKDAVNADGTIKPQGVDLSRVVPILVAAIQELSAEVNALKNA